MSRLLRLDAGEFRRYLNRRPFRIGHALCGEPLFELTRLAELAAALPAEQVEYNAGDIPVNQDPDLTPQNGLGPEETVRRIEQCRSWMVLKNVERDPAFAALLRDCLAELREHSEPLLPGMHLPEAFVFVSSPGSVTPFHIDPEHNFLLQIRGGKTLHVFDPADRDLVSALDLERFFAGAHRNLRFDDAWQARATTVELGPGDGVHVPVTAPHWVQNGASVSVSFSVTFRSRASRRHADVWQMNHRLRRLGLQPSPAGRSAATDFFKQQANRAIRALVRARAVAAQPLASRRSRA